MIKRQKWNSVKCSEPRADVVLPESSFGAFTREKPMETPQNMKLKRE
jgi:hypothetical protein